MGTISKRVGKKRTTYRAQVLIDGTRYGESFPSKKAALAWINDMEAKKNQGKYIMPSEAKQRTVAQLIDRYMEEHLPQLRSRQDRERELLRWRELLGDVKLYQLSSDQIVQARSEIMKQTNRYGEPISNSTVNRYYAAFHAVLNVAEREYGWIDTNPMKMVKKLKEPQGRTRYLKDDEQKRLLEAAIADSNPIIFSVVLMCLVTGMRKEEALTLEWSNVDFEQERIIIEETKNGERRAAYMPEHLAKHLRVLKAQGDAHSRFVFPSRDGLRPASTKSAWYRVIKASGVSDFRFHDLRHTNATYLAQNGASVPEISAGLGQKSFQMAARYTHLMSLGNKPLVEKMVKKSLVELDDE